MKQSIHPSKKNIYSRYVAIDYISNLDSNQKVKLKRMLENNILCCAGVAKAYSLDPNELQAELLDILEEA